MGPGPAGGELRGDDLVHDRDVGLDAEEGVVELDVARSIPSAVVSFTVAMSVPLARLDGVADEDEPPFGPGTDP